MALVNKIFNKIWSHLAKFSSSGCTSGYGKSAASTNSGNSAAAPDSKALMSSRSNHITVLNALATHHNQTRGSINPDTSYLKILDTIRTVSRPFPQCKGNNPFRNTTPITRKLAPRKSVRAYKQILPQILNSKLLRTKNVYTNTVRCYKKRSCPPPKKPFDPDAPCIIPERICGRSPREKKVPRNLQEPLKNICDEQLQNPCGAAAEIIKCKKIALPCCPRPYRDRCPLRRHHNTFPPAVKPPKPCFSDYVSLYKEFVCPECIYKQIDIRPSKNPLVEDEMKPRPHPYIAKIILPQLVKHTLMDKKLPRMKIAMPSVPDELAHCLGNPDELKEAKKHLCQKHRILCEIRSLVNSYLDCPSTSGNGGGEDSVRACRTAHRILTSEIEREKSTQKKVWRISMPNCPHMYRKKCEKIRRPTPCDRVRPPAPCYHECIRDEFPTECDSECCLQPFKAKYQAVKIPDYPPMIHDNFEYLLTTIKDPKDRVCEYTEPRIPPSRLQEQLELLRRFKKQECD